jgi:hypothetical protein
MKHKNFFSSENFSLVASFIQNNLKINLNDNPLQVNYFLSCFRSNKIYHCLQSISSNIIDFSEFEYPHLITNILQNQHGIKSDVLNLDQMIETLLYLQVDFLKYQNLIQTAQQFEKILFFTYFETIANKLKIDMLYNVCQSFIKTNETQEFFSHLKILV